MCGIVGLASRAPVSRRELLVKMRDTLRHRGPDDAGAWWASDGTVGLAHQRLAIIDLSSNGHQPMADISKEFWIVFNGEIYNYLELRKELEGKGHLFRSASDTEVILESYRSWGVDCLQHLNGMFAFCLYDTMKRRLFLARDRVGEKPLFYQHKNGRFVFSSELKGLMADPSFPRQLNLNALDFYLAYGYVPGDMCILNGVHKLPQGHAMTYDIDKDSLRIWPYWGLPEPTAKNHLSLDELVGKFEKLLEDAVRKQQIADVPVGILLSGGIDSSLVTAIAANASSSPIKTFTVSFPGHDTFDEGPYARLVADHFGTQHTELKAEPVTVEVLPQLARQFDEPLADHAIVPVYLISELIRQHATVALSGDGGDELFGGYGHYSWIQRQERLRPYIPGLFRKGAAYAATRFLPLGTRGRNHLIGYGEGLGHTVAHVNMYFDQRSRAQLLSPVEKKEGSLQSPESYRAGLCQNVYSATRQAMEADFKSTLVDGYLVKVDRASMLASLEVRAPFLDYRIIEFAFGRVPDSMRVSNSQLKIIPRTLAKRILPSALDLKRKQGFTMPLSAWFKGRWGGYIKSILCEADTALFDQRMILRLLSGQQHGYSNINRLFALTMFELWRREYRVQF